MQCRCGGVAWGDDSFALLYESWYKTRKSKVWIFLCTDSFSGPLLLYNLWRMFESHPSCVGLCSLSMARHARSGQSWKHLWLRLSYLGVKASNTQVWMIAPGQRDKQKEILFDRDYEDAYSDPGSPALRRTSRSTYVIARLEGSGQLIMQGVPCLSYMCFELALYPMCRAVDSRSAAGL